MDLTGKIGLCAWSGSRCPSCRMSCRRMSLRKIGVVMGMGKGFGRKPQRTGKREEVGAERVESRQDRCRKRRPKEHLKQALDDRRDAWHSRADRKFRPCSRIRRETEILPMPPRRKEMRQCVTGSTFLKPPKCRISITFPIACITLPAERKRSDLKACVNMWKMAAVTAAAAKASPAAALPRPRTCSPIG